MTKEKIREHQKQCEELKEALAPGPWKNEPDRVQFVSHGLDCLVIRSPKCGHFCGYVGVPESHPWFSKEYDEIDVEVHGGLTYSEECGGFVCHLVDDCVNEKVKWFGFDCLHAEDFAPVDHGHPGFKLLTYRDISYLEHETCKLARQARDAAIELCPSRI